MYIELGIFFFENASRAQPGISKIFFQSCPKRYTPTKVDIWPRIGFLNADNAT
jgi:hypothetical protein